MNLNYVLKKIYNRFEIFNLRKNKIDDGLYLLNKSEKKVESILFYFPHFQLNNWDPNHLLWDQYYLRLDHNPIG